MPKPKKKFPVYEAKLIPLQQRMVCPYCASDNLGTLDRVDAVATTNYSTDKGLQYTGETEVLWDTQKTRLKGYLYCLNCHSACRLPRGMKPS